MSRRHSWLVITCSLLSAFNGSTICDIQKCFWWIFLQCGLLCKRWALVHAPSGPRLKKVWRTKSPNGVPGTYAPVASGKKPVDSAPGRRPLTAVPAPRACHSLSGRVGQHPGWHRPHSARTALSLLPSRWANPQGKEALREILLSSFFPNGLCYKKQMEQPLFLSSTKLADWHPAWCESSRMFAAYLLMPTTAWRGRKGRTRHQETEHVLSSKTSFFMGSFYLILFYFLLKCSWHIILVSAHHLANIYIILCSQVRWPSVTGQRYDNILDSLP